MADGLGYEQLASSSLAAAKIPASTIAWLTVERRQICPRALFRFAESND
jgi:hypothetical protein